MELDGKERDVIRSRLCPWEETQRKREIIKVETSPGKWTVQTTFWAPQLWGLIKGSSAHLADWRVSEINRRVVGSPISAHEEYTNVCLHLKQGGGATLKPQNWLIVVFFFFFFSVTTLVHGSVWAKQILQHSLPCVAAPCWRKGWHDWGKSSTVRYCWDWNPESE